MQALALMRSLPRGGRGTARRNYHLLELVREAGFQVHVVSLPEVGQRREEAIESVRGVCRHTHLFKRQPWGLWRGLRAWARSGSYTQAHDHHPAMVAKVAKLLPQSRLVVNVDPLLHRVIADAMGKLLTDRDAAAKSGERGRSLVSAAATWQVQWRRVAALLTQIAKGEPLNIESDRTAPRRQRRQQDQPKPGPVLRSVPGARTR